MLKKFVTILLLLVGAINFVPIVGVLGQPSLERLYALGILAPDVLALMKHRAVLLAIVGGFLLVSALKSFYRIPASICAYISMVSYILIIWTGDVENQALVKIYQIDMAAIALLVIANAVDWQLLKRDQLPIETF